MGPFQAFGGIFVLCVAILLLPLCIVRVSEVRLSNISVWGLRGPYVSQMPAKFAKVFVRESRTDSGDIGSNIVGVDGTACAWDLANMEGVVAQCGVEALIWNANSKSSILWSVALRLVLELRWPSDDRSLRMGSLSPKLIGKDTSLLYGFFRMVDDMSDHDSDEPRRIRFQHDLNQNEESHVITLFTLIEVQGVDGVDETSLSAALAAHGDVVLRVDGKPLLDGSGSGSL